MMNRLDNHTMRIESIINSYSDLIYTNNNIIGFGLGNKIIGDTWTNIPCLTIYVNKKLANDSMSKEMLVPKYINGVLTDIIESYPTQRNTLPSSTNVIAEQGNNIQSLGIGSSIGNVNNDYGGTVTLGLSGVLNENKGEQFFALGSATSITKINPTNGSIGSLGDAIIEPANKPKTVSKKVLFKAGRILDISPIDVGVNKSPSTTTSIDSALVLLNDGVSISNILPKEKKLKGFTKVSVKDEIYYIGSVSGTIKSKVVSIKGSFRKTINNSNGNTNIIEYRGVTSVAINNSNNRDDEGAIGITHKTLSGEYGFGMLVVTIGNVALFTDLQESVDYFSSKFKLSVL